MVTFWPWKGDDSSPASFEKALSTLSAKISKSSSKLDGLRQRSRRFSVLWTLYAGFAYLLYTIILGLVVGWRAWGLVEYAAVAGGPVVIYLVRLGLSSYYGYRTSRIQAQLDDLQKQRDATIEKLKTATKYNSTQELLQKYGGTPTPKVKSKEGSDQKNSPRQNGPKSSSGTRTSFIPPPTANISRLNDPNSMQPSPQQRPPSYPPTPISQANSPSSPYAQAPTQRPRLLSDASAEFAPNAFASAPQYSHGDSGPRWYDRIMDVLLGEDETRPGARFALICAECRLVNGQAPPGVKTLEDLGRWRCEGCGTMNGEESQAKKIVASIRKEQTSSKGTEEARIQERPRIAAKITSEEPEPPSAEDEETDITQYFSEEEEQEAEESNEEASKPTTESEAPRRRSTRPTKGKKTAG